MRHQLCYFVALANAQSPPDYAVLTGPGPQGQEQPIDATANQPPDERANQISSINDAQVESQHQPEEGKSAETVPQPAAPINADTDNPNTDPIIEQPVHNPAAPISDTAANTTNWETTPETRAVEDPVKEALDAKLVSVAPVATQSAADIQAPGDSRAISEEHAPSPSNMAPAANKDAPPAASGYSCSGYGYSPPPGSFTTPPFWYVPPPNIGYGPFGPYSNQVQETKQNSDLQNPSAQSDIFAQQPAPAQGQGQGQRPQQPAPASGQGQHPQQYGPQFPFPPLGGGQHPYPQGAPNQQGDQIGRIPGAGGFPQFPQGGFPLAGGLHGGLIPELSGGKGQGELGGILGGHNNGGGASVPYSPGAARGEFPGEFAGGLNGFNSGFPAGVGGIQGAPAGLPGAVGGPQNAELAPEELFNDMMPTHVPLAHAVDHGSKALDGSVPLQYAQEPIEYQEPPVATPLLLDDERGLDNAAKNRYEIQGDGFLTYDWSNEYWSITVNGTSTGVALSNGATTMSLGSLMWMLIMNLV